jgi:hypothetical protein
VWALALFQCWIICVDVILLILWRRKGCLNKHKLCVLCGPTYRDDS